MQQRLIVMGVCLVFAIAAEAQTVFRFIDADGRVIFSDRPPPGAARERVEEVRIRPGPTPEQTEAAIAAEQAQREALETARSVHSGQTTDRNERIAAAEERVARARDDLERARVMNDDDWQRLTNGNRVPRAAYRERVEAAEAALREAERELDAVRRER